MPWSLEHVGLLFFSLIFQKILMETVSIMGLLTINGVLTNIEWECIMYQARNIVLKEGHPDIFTSKKKKINKNRGEGKGKTQTPIFKS